MIIYISVKLYMFYKYAIYFLVTYHISLDKQNVDICDLSSLKKDFFKLNFLLSTLILIFIPNLISYIRKFNFLIHILYMYNEEVLIMQLNMFVLLRPFVSICPSGPHIQITKNTYYTSWWNH